MGRPRVYFSEEKFWSRFDKRDDGCWLWRRESKLIIPHYPVVLAPDGSRKGAHIIAYELASGEDVPEGLYVCHTCDEHDCARNDDVGTYSVSGVDILRYGHLFLGTSSMNSQDCKAKGHSWWKGFGRYRAL